MYPFSDKKKCCSRRRSKNHGYKIRKYDSAADKEQYEIFKATIRLIIRQVTARIKGTIIDLSNQSKNRLECR